MKTKTHYPSYTLSVEDAFHYADSALVQELPDTETPHAAYDFINAAAYGLAGDVA